MLCIVLLHCKREENYICVYEIGLYGIFGRPRARLQMVTTDRLGSGYIMGKIV